MFDATFQNKFGFFEDDTAIFHGERAPITPGDHPRRFSCLVKCCTLGGELVDARRTAFSPSEDLFFELLFPCSSWQETTPPAAGDKITLTRGELTYSLIAKTTLTDGIYYTVRCAGSEGDYREL